MTSISGSLKRPWFLLTTSVSCAAVATFFAVHPAAAAEPSAVLNVKDFNDAGGAAQKGPDGKPILARLATAMRTFLSEDARGRYAVAGVSSAAPKNAPHFVVESDVSALEVNDAEKRPYLLVVRMYREDKPHRLVAQFAGSAQSLRDLTSNMRNVSGISTMGLVGEISKRVAEAALSAHGPEDSFAALLASTTATRRLTVDVMAGSALDQKPRNTLSPGERYHLRVSTQDVGQVYIVGLGEGGRPISVYAQNEPLDAAPGKPVILPPNTPFVAPRSGTVEYLILLRRRDKSGTAGGTTASSVKKDPAYITPDGFEERSAGGSTRGGGLRRGGGTIGRESMAAGETGQAIEILSNTSLPAGEKPDAGVEALLSLYRNDPSGTWEGVRVKLPVVP